MVLFIVKWIRVTLANRREKGIYRSILCIALISLIPFFRRKRHPARAMPLLSRAKGSTVEILPLGAKVEVRIRKGITAHAHGHYCACPTQKGAYQLRNTKIHSSRRMAFSAGEKYHATLRYAENRSIPFFASICEGDPDPLQGCRFGTMEPQVVPEGFVWCQERIFWCQIIRVG